jgi:undecaprenyl diphosphate synthase
MTVPEHVAIIMDGNGRWAEKRGKNRIFGHRAGAKTLENTLRVCCRRGVKYLTVYAFSTENWKRPEAEVNGLMTLLSVFVSAKEKLLMKERIRFQVLSQIR